MRGAWTRGGRAGAALALVVAATTVVLVPPASARACSDLGVEFTQSGDRARLLLSLPQPLRRAVLAPADVRVVQDGARLPVQAVAKVAPAAGDVALVVDVSVAAAPAADAVRAAAAAFVAQLSPDTRLALVSAGGSPTVVRRLGVGPQAALPAVDALPTGGATDLPAAIRAAIDQLPAAVGRQQQVVVIAGGPGQVADTSWSPVSAVLTRRGIPLDVLDLSSTGPSLPQAGRQCPGAVAPDGAVAAATALADEVAARRLVRLGPVTGTAPLVVTVSSGESRRRRRSGAERRWRRRRPTRRRTGTTAPLGSAP